MAAPTPESSYDAVKFVTSRVRVIYGLLTVLTAPVVWGGFRAYDLGVFVEKDRAHEEKQDQVAKDVETKFKLVDLERERTNTTSDERMKVLLSQIALLRETLLEQVHPRKQAKLRQKFQAQQAKLTEVLIGSARR